ncbi:putative manganese transporter [Gemmatimonadota bacterium]
MLACVTVLNRMVDLTRLVSGNQWGVLVAAVLLGIVPESGPHLVFVTLFDAGTIPLTILAASSIVQDGHGMLPLLAESKAAFVKVKAINVLVGLLLGAVLLAAGA